MVFDDSALPPRSSSQAINTKFHLRRDSSLDFLQNTHRNSCNDDNGRTDLSEANGSIYRSDEATRWGTVRHRFRVSPRSCEVGLGYLRMH
jgi:hypothetical protein